MSSLSGTSYDSDSSLFSYAERDKVIPSYNFCISKKDKKVNIHLNNRNSTLTSRSSNHHDHEEIQLKKSDKIDNCHSHQVMNINPTGPNKQYQSNKRFMMKYIINSKLYRCMKAIDHIQSNTSLVRDKPPPVNSHTVSDDVHTCDKNKIKFATTKYVQKTSKEPNSMTTKTLFRRKR